MDSSPTANIIFDVPSKTDAFDGKGHERSAKALAEGIDQVFLNGGGAIGLEGAWGAGKSSVIEMAESRLEEIGQKNTSEAIRYHVFAFDLWTHQTDEFRRAFLERFLDFMSTATFDHQVDIEIQRDRIRNRKKEVTNESRHRYTPAGAVLVLLLPFLPLVYAWLNPSAFASDKVQVFAQILGVVAIAAFLIGLVMIRDRYLRLPDDVRSNLKTFPQKFARGASELLVLTKKIDQETSVQWIRDEDPTTVEFQKTFRDILSKAQTQTNRLVFVLDNIDRLSGDSVKDAWSEMRSLLTGRQDRTPAGELQQPVVVVVPYDRQIVTKALTDKHEDTDLFAKTFHRILRVSPPLGSHWVGFLEGMLKKAFGDQHDEDATYRLYRLLQFYLQSENMAATPRRIVSFVNDLGSYWTQWGGSIPVEAMAVFVLLRHDIERYFSTLGEPDFDLPSYQKISRQDDLLRQLAALHFNVPPADAEEILLAAPLARALTAPTPDDLKRLRQIEGFDRFFSRFLPGCLAGRGEQPAVVAQAAKNIAALELKGPLAEDIAIQLADYLPDIEAFDLGDSKGVREGLNAIIALQPAANTLATADAVKGIIEGVQSKDAETSDYDKGFQWTDYVTDICEQIQIKLGEEEAQRFWATALPKVSAEFALGVAYLAEDHDDFRYLSLVGSPPLTELVTAMQATIPQGGRIVADVANEIRSALKPEMRVALLNAIGAHLRAAVVDQKEADQFLIACGTLASPPLADKTVLAAIAKLTSDGTVLYYTHKSEEAKSIAGGIYVLIKQFGTGTAIPPTDPHAVLGTLAPAAEWYLETLVDGVLPEGGIAQLAELVSDTRSFGLWLGYVASQPARSLFDVTVREMVAKRRLGVVGSTAASAFINSYPQLHEVLGLEGLASVANAMGAAMTDENAVSDDALLTLPRELVDNIEDWSPGTPLGKLVDRIDSLLRSTTADEWEGALSDGDREAPMLIIRIAKAGIKLSAKEYLEGYRRSALNVLASDHGADLVPEDWNLLYQAIPNASRKVLARGVMTDLDRKGVKPEGAAEFVINYADLAASLPLEDYPDTTVQILLRELVLSESEEVKAYIRDQKKRPTKSVAILQSKRASDTQGEDALSVLEDAISSLEQANVEDAWAAELRTILALPKPPAEEHAKAE